MTQVSTLTNVSTYSGFDDYAVIDLFKDILEGETRDYFAFQYDSDSYILAICNDDSLLSPISCASEGCTVYQIDVIPHSSSQSRSLPFSGNGELLGQNGGVIYLTGNTSYTDTTTYNSYDLITFTSDVSVSNSGSHLIFGSADSMPHLVEGVENYAFSAFILAFGVIAFNLFDRIFKRVY